MSAAQKPARARVLRAVGATLVLVGLIVVFTSPLVGAWLGDMAPPTSTVASSDAERRHFVVGVIPFIVVLGCLPLLIGARIWNRAARHLVPPAAALLDAAAPAPVLYLRPFRFERFLAGNPALTLEEHIVFVLQRFAPVVAVGRPGDRLPPLGAARWYLDGDDWQGAVARQLDRAALVFIRFDKGEGIGWEVEEALRRVPPQRLVLLVPAAGRALEAFARRASPAIRDVLRGAAAVEPMAGRTLLIWFGPGGEPKLAGAGPSRGGWRRLLAGRSEPRFEYELNRALRPVFELHGIRWETLVRSPWRRFLAFVPLIILMSCLLFIIVMNAWNRQDAAMQGSNQAPADAAVASPPP